MRGRLILLTTATWILVSVAVILLYRRNTEPIYNGHTLSFWVEGGYSDMLGLHSKAPLTTADFQQAIRAMGTNAHPWLLRWIAYEPSNLPDLLRQLPPDRFWSTTVGKSLIGSGPKDDLASAASYACAVLGTNAPLPLDPLMSLMTNRNHPKAALRAVIALQNLGDSAIPAYDDALSRTNQPWRTEIVQSLYRMLLDGRTTTNKCLPILIKACSDPESVTRHLARKCVADLSPGALTNAPAD
jgi:hypothetical protein